MAFVWKICFREYFTVKQQGEKKKEQPVTEVVTSSISSHELSKGYNNYFEIRYKVCTHEQDGQGQIQ